LSLKAKLGFHNGNLSKGDPKKGLEEREKDEWEGIRVYASHSNKKLLLYN